LSRERLEGNVEVERTSGEGSGVRALEGTSRVEPLGVRMGEEVLKESSLGRGVKEREVGRTRFGVATEEGSANAAGVVFGGVPLFVLVAGCGRRGCPGRLLVRMRSWLWG
jgi:hypothetical protein